MTCAITQDLEGPGLALMRADTGLEFLIIPKCILICTEFHGIGNWSRVDF